MACRFDTIRFEDVRIGDELPTLTMPLTVRKCVMAASAARDWQPYHHDQDHAREVSKTRHMFIGMWFYAGMSSRLITDWAGPEAFMSKLKFKMKQPACAGDELKVNGRVTGARVEGDKHVVELAIEFSTHLGVTTTATAEAIIPAKSPTANTR